MFLEHYPLMEADIIEQDKMGGSFLGSKLLIGNETYGSLNEICDRYVKPCERYVRDAISSRKFFDCDYKGDFLLYDYEKDEDIHFEFDKVNPDLKQLIEVSIDAIKEDSELLKEYGIAKKPTKKYPISFSEIDWNIYNKFI